VPMDERKPRLLQALNALYRGPEELRQGVTGVASIVADRDAVQASSPAVPWLSGPEDSWL
jgi:hypothetical protein